MPVEGSERVGSLSISLSGTCTRNGASSRPEQAISYQTFDIRTLNLVVLIPKIVGECVVSLWHDCGQPPSKQQRYFAHPTCFPSPPSPTFWLLLKHGYLFRAAATEQRFSPPLTIPTSLRRRPLGKQWAVVDRGAAVVSHGGQFSLQSRCRNDGLVSRPGNSRYKSLSRVAHQRRRPTDRPISVRTPLDLPRRWTSVRLWRSSSKNI